MNNALSSYTSVLQIVLLAIILFGCNKDKDHSITIGKKQTIHSAILNEDRGLWIHVPEAGEYDSAAKFPVLYLLDGDSHFYSMVGMIHQLSSVNGNDVCPKMIVVAIPNTNRMRDLTPSHVTSDGADSAFFKASGGGEAFTRFISDELMPYIEKNYPVSDERILVGHSLGGLMAIDIMIKKKELFDKYIAIDPSLWWDNHKSLEEYQNVIQTIDLSKKSLFIGVANTIEMDTAQALLDDAEKTDHFRSIIQFTRSLKNTNSKVDWRYKYYGDEGHGSVPLITEYDALHFLFRKIPITLDPTTLKTFEGLYKHQFTEGVDSFISISIEGDVLVLHEQWSDRKIRFNALSETDFYAMNSQFPLRFIKNNAGEISEALAFHRDVWKKINSPQDSK
jgi:uncharacterized protein